jgi:hypothetical protein
MAVVWSFDRCSIRNMIGHRTRGEAAARYRLSVFTTVSDIVTRVRRGVGISPMSTWTIGVNVPWTWPGLHRRAVVRAAAVGAFSGAERRVPFFRWGMAEPTCDTGAETIATVRLRLA